MAWVRCCGGTAKSSKIMFYKEGTMFVGFDTYTNYAYGSYTKVAYSINSNNIGLITTSGNNSTCFGTTAKIDLSNIRTLFARVKGAGNPNGAKFILGAPTSKDFYGASNTYNFYPVSTSDEVTISLDVSAINEERYIGLCSACSSISTSGFYLYELWGE